MTTKTLTWLFAGAVAISAIPAQAAAQPAAFKAPRTSAGPPDLQGTWTNSSLTRLERPAQYGARNVLTKEEAARMENANAEGVARGNAITPANATVHDITESCATGAAGAGSGANCAYNTGWIDPGSTVMTVAGQPRASFITFPADGRVPPVKATATQRNAARPPRVAATQNDNPETRSLGERCLMSFGYSAGPVMQPLLYNNNYKIVQSKDAVAILVEMVHDVRIVRLNATHRTDGVRPWLGDSIGHYEGDVLVVETTNFPAAQTAGFRGASPDLKVTERFSRVAGDRLLYRFTVEDPQTWDAAWGGEYEFGASKGDLYEYACHEGNYGLEGILSGARAEEAEAKKTAAR